MKNLQIFNNPQFGDIRMVKINDQPYAVGNDVAVALGYAKPRNAITQHCKGALKRGILTNGGKQMMSVIPEGDLYRLIVHSQLPAADAFERWIFDEVLPTIRRTGNYGHVSEIKHLEVEAKTMRARAMEMNAKTRALQTIMKTVGNKNLSQIALEVYGLKALEVVTGKDVGNLLPEVEKTYSATEIGKMLSVSAQKVGSLANKNGLKCEKYGITVLDKSPYSAKEVCAFRYNQRGVDAITKLLGYSQRANAK